MVMWVYAYAAEDTESAELMGQVYQTSFPIMFAVLLVVAGATLNRNNLTYAIWHFFTFVQFHRWTPLANPGSTDYYTEFYTGVSQSINQFNFVEEDSYPNEVYRTYGIKSYFILHNATTVLVVWVVFMAFGLLLCCIGARAPQLLSSLRFNLMLRVTLLCYMDIVLFAAIQLKGLRVDNAVEVASSVLGILLIFASSGFTFAVPIVTRISYDRSEASGQSEYLRLLKTLFAEFTEESPKPYNFYTVFCFSRFSAALFYAIFEDIPLGLVISVGLAQLSLLIYLAIVKPYKNWAENAFVFLAEFTSLLVLIGSSVMHLDSISEGNSLGISIICISCTWMGYTLCVARALYVMIPHQQPLSKISPGMEAATMSYQAGEIPIESVKHATDLTLGTIPNEYIQEVPIGSKPSFWRQLRQKLSWRKRSREQIDTSIVQSLPKEFNISTTITIPQEINTFQGNISLIKLEKIPEEDESQEAIHQPSEASEVSAGPSPRNTGPLQPKPKPLETDTKLNVFGKLAQRHKQ